MKLELFDVADVEKLCIRVINESAFSGKKGRDREDLLAYLVSTSWIESTKFDPLHSAEKYGKKGSFSTYIYRILKLRVASGARSYYGDERYTPKPHMVSLFVTIDGEECINPEAEIVASVVDEIDDVPAFFEDLSQEGKGLLLEVAIPLSKGGSIDEVAKTTGLGRAGVKDGLATLQQELTRLGVN